MSNQFSLLKTRRFLPIFITQFLGALNDNTFKQALIILFTFHAASVINVQPTILNNLAAGLFILPYFLFSSTAGQIADKYEKSKLTQYIKIFEIMIMSLVTIAFFTHTFWLFMVALFGMGTHATFFGPIKYSILPQLLTRDEIVGGNGLFETGTSFATLAGMILGGTIMTIAGTNYFWISGTLLIIAIVGYLFSHEIPARAIGHADLKINWNVLATTRQTLQYASNLGDVSYTILGISWFWYYGATFLTQIPVFTREILHGSESVVTFLLTVFSVGIALGSLLCEHFTGRHAQLKLVPFGAVGLTASAIFLYLASRGLVSHSEHQNMIDVISQAQYWPVFIAFAGIGMFGGFYIVPLYAHLQYDSPESFRARVIAANSIMNALFMVVSSVVSVAVLSWLHRSIPELFLLTAIISAVVSLIVIKHLNTDNTSS
ncbi:MAG: MFS transporter [Gammaproteobacteria bacterium]|nr:MFS transporter [Gammaproteobacteria bacterium]